MVQERAEVRLGQRSRVARGRPAEGHQRLGEHHERRTGLAVESHGLAEAAPERVKQEGVFSADEHREVAPERSRPATGQGR